VKKSCLVAAILCAALFASLAPAQTGAIVSGTVTDPSGAHIIGATVSVRNVDTGVVVTATANEAGVYTMPSLIPGRYQLTAEHGGFRKAVINDVVLAVGANLTLNIPLEIGLTSESIEVQATATEVNATSASIGDVVDGKKLLDLPLVARSAYDLLLTQPGVTSGALINGSGNYYLNGNQGASINFTFDGITAMDNLHNSTFYMYTNIVSVDRAGEFRVVTSPADAEFGRGAGQVQMVTRAGTNKFAGSAWEEFRNGHLNSNNWFNNAAGSNADGSPLAPRSPLKQNNYGLRFGGPLRKNKTFFNGIWEPFKERNILTANETVYTQSARQGVFRFYSGVVNGNVTTAVPTVDSSGNPIQPAAATGGLQSVSVLNRDPNRLSLDPTGVMTHVFSYMPLPNNFRFGDGLNTAGFTWAYPLPEDFELYEGRIDHVIDEKNRLALTLSHQAFHSYNYTTPSPFPTVPGQFNSTETTNYTVALTSVFRPNLLNDARIGVYRTRTIVGAPYSPGDPGFTGFLTPVGGYPSIVTPAGVSSPYVGANGVGPVPGDYLNPNYQYGDTMTWIKGRHSFKGGFQLRYISFAGFDFGTSNNVPNVRIGAPVLNPVTNISTGANPITGIGQNATSAASLLYDLTGSINGTTGVTQTDFATGGKNPVFLPGLTSFRNWHQNEFDWFFKDDFKVSTSLTLNLGLRWELYLPPTEMQGRELAPVGGAGSVFGISGTNLGSLFNPNATGGSQTAIQQIGPNTANPGKQLFNTPLRNFAPALGLAWVVPGQGMWRWLSGGPNKMTIRMGYGIGYQRFPISLSNTESGAEPGISSTQTLLTATNLSQVQLPLQPTGAPLSVVPLTGPGSHTQTVYGIDQNLRTPYTQNYNLTISRALPASLVLTVAYVGSKSSQLVRSVNINEVNIFENGILQGFNAIEAGGTSPLIDKIFSNGYAAVAAAGGGSNYVRTNSSTQAFFANNNPGGFANFISTTTALSGVAGGLLTNAGLPLNFIVANPQFLNAVYTGNFGNSTYNSGQFELNRRFSHGLTIQGTYVLSHAIGDSEGDSASYSASYRTLRNEHIDKRPLSFDFVNVVKLNGLYELPFGKGKPIGGNANGFVDRFIGGWQLGAIGFLNSGSPLTFTAQNTINNTTASASFTANQVGPLPSTGVQRVGTGVVYFGGFTQLTDPAVANLPTATLRAVSALKAIADANGNLLLINPLPGQLGALGQSVIRGPGFKNVNVNLIKHIKINERFNMQIGASAQNFTNTPIFGNPNTNIESTSFGRITALGAAASSSIGAVNPVAGSGARIIVLQARVNF
jgi:hypothetical protein